MEAHGTRYEVDAGRMSRIVDRTGRTWARLDWHGDRLARLAVPGAYVLGALVRDRLFGTAHPICFDDDARTPTAMTALDWARPTEIPALAAPGRLPAGTGGALLNAIAVLAARAHVPALRYAGPYPTSALWRALGRSFRATATEAEFTNDLLGRAARVARDPIAIDFAPAPCERVVISRIDDGASARADSGSPFAGADPASRGYVELRDGLERVVLDGVTYEPGGSPACLIDGRAEVWFGDARWAVVAAFTADGALAGGPHPLPVCTSDVVGKPFPAELSRALAEVVAEAVPAPLAAAARRTVASGPIRWADLGARGARATRGGLEVHAALWERIGPLGLGRLALALAEALAPVVTTAVVAELTGAIDPGPLDS